MSRQSHQHPADRHGSHGRHRQNSRSFGRFLTQALRLGTRRGTVVMGLASFISLFIAITIGRIYHHINLVSELLLYLATAVFFALCGHSYYLYKKRCLQARHPSTQRSVSASVHSIADSYMSTLSVQVTSTTTHSSSSHFQHAFGTRRSDIQNNHDNYGQSGLPRLMQLLSASIQNDSNDVSRASLDLPPSYLSAMAESNGQQSM